MKYSEFKDLIEQGKLLQFEQQIEAHNLVAADINLLLKELIRSKAKKITSVFEKLLKKGADVNFADVRNNKSNLMVACEEGTLEAVQLLIAHPKIDFQFEDSMKKTAPFYAIDNKNKNDGEIFLDKILQRAPHLTNRPANNQTLLILAIKRQKPQLVRILLTHKAEPNYVIVDSGNTPLHEALKMCKNKETKANKEIVKMLIEHGANPMIKNKKDKNVYEFAEKFPLAQLIAQVPFKNRIVPEKVQVPASLPLGNNEIAKQQNTETPKEKKTNKTPEETQKSSGRSKRSNQMSAAQQSWQKSPIHKQKSRKDFNRGKEYQNQNRQARELRDQQRQNRQNRQYRQNRQNRAHRGQKVLTLNTEQQITQLISRADHIYDRQMERKEQQYTRQVQKKRTQEDNFISEDESDSSCTDSSDTDSEHEQLTEDQMVAPSYRKKEEFTASLSQEILKLEKKCDEAYFTAQRQFQHVYTKMRQIAYAQGLDIQLYGSFKTGLWYKNCDIDILLVPQDQMIAQKNPNYIETILDRFEILLKKEDSIKINTFMKNKKIRVPMLRLDIELFPYKRNKSRKIDITVIDRNHNGMNIAHYINENLRMFPQLKPLFFVIKSLTYHFKLNDPKTGGIRTYGIIIMILSFLQNQRMKGTKVEETELGELLLRFLYFFGFEYQYGYEMVQDYPGAAVEPLMKLTIYDPLNHSNNLGNNAKAYELQSMFKAAFISLHSNIKEEKLEFMFGLKKIFMFC